MKIEFLGHATFRITGSNGTTIVTDPFESGYGNGALAYGKIEDPADIVTISHEHGDHNFPAGVPGNPEIVKGAGSRTLKGVEIKGVSTFHDDTQGSQRGANVVNVFDVDGVKVCHLGDLGHSLSAEEGAAIGDVDVVLVPVGGFYTIDANVATQVVDALKPSVAIPMHFKNEKCAFPIGSVDGFLAGKSNVQMSDSSLIELTKGSLPSGTQIVVLKPAL